MATPRHHISLRNIYGLNISNCNFRNTAGALFSPYSKGYGIYGFNANFRCTGNMDYANNYFHYLSAGVVATNPLPGRNYTVDGMGFDQNNIGVMDLGGLDSRITNNAFGIGNGLTVSIGVHLFQSERYVVERNVFDGNPSFEKEMGIYFTGPSYADNEVYNNDFTNLDIACAVQNRHAAFDDEESIVDGLQMRCGTHTNNQVDQFLYDGAYIRHD